MKSPFLNQLHDSLQTSQLQNQKLLIAVSGGADSMALLRGLRETEQCNLIVGHLNHQLRGEQSDDDAAWVAEECAKLAVPCIAESENVAAIAKQAQTGLEETARRVRYDFLTRTAQNENCKFVAVAHHADDQVETVLHHIIRGTGISGLKGMPFTRQLAEGIQLIRPLLQVRKVDIESYLQEINQQVRVDASNHLNDFTRNRIRNELLPLLAQNYNPNVREAIARLSQQAVALQSAITTEAKLQLRKAICDDASETVRLSRSVLVDLPEHIQRECFVELWRHKNWPRQRMGFEAWARLAESINSAQPHTFPGGIQLTHRDDIILLRRG